MNGMGKSVKGGLIPPIRPTLVILSISLAFFLPLGCSNEEPQEAKRAKRIVRIKTPPYIKDSAPKAGADESEKRASPGSDQAHPMAKKEITPPREEQPKPGKNREKETGGPDKKASLKIAEAPPAAKRGAYPPQDKRPEPGKDKERVVALKHEKPPPPEKDREGVEGHYKVRHGDTLSKIAGLQNVYNDPMKWPSLFRLNMDKFGPVNVEEGFADKPLPEGLDLRLLTPSEAKENLEKLGPRHWVINVMSVERPGRIVPAAIALMKKGYRVYLTRARVKGKDWVRLRVGFFKDSSEADAARKAMMPMINNAWLAKIGNKELEESGGY